MLAKDLVSDVVPPLRTSDTGAIALNWMDVFKINHLPIVNNSELLGLISDADIFDLNCADEPVGNHSLSLNRPYALADQHIYEVLDLFSKLKLSALPVLDSKSEYQGLIIAADLLHQASNLMAVNHPGGILVLELNENDYMLSQIAQIVEGNDAKILSLYIHSIPDSTRIELTIKVNRTDLSSILQTFNRYNYQIKASYKDKNAADEMFNDRYDLFIKYLSI